MNNKIVSVVLVAGIAVTGFAGISAADEGLIGEGMEQRVDAFEAKFQSGKNKGMKHLTDDEKTALESMSDEEKTVFFEAKKAEKMAQKEATKGVIDKLVAGESLTAAEETIRLEALAKIEERSGKHNKPGAEIISKILAGDELSSDEETVLAEMQEKRAEREAQRAVISPIIEKKKSGEELTDEEQAVLDEMKENRSERKGHKGGRDHK